MALDISSIEASLTLWEYAECVSVVFVIVGVLGEYIADFTKLWTGGDPEKRHRLSKISTLVLIVALAVELVCLMQISQLSGRIIAALHSEALRQEVERLKLQALLLPRRLSGEHQKRLTETLSPYSGIPVDVFSVEQEDKASSDEVIGFAKDLVLALSNASLDAAGHIGAHCQPWPLVGVIVEAPQDLSRDRYAAGIILDALKLANVGVIPYVVGELPSITPIKVPPCSMFGAMTPERPKKVAGWAKIIIIIGKKPAPILKVEGPQQPVALPR